MGDELPWNTESGLVNTIEEISVSVHSLTTSINTSEANVCQQNMGNAGKIQFRVPRYFWFYTGWVRMGK